MENNNTNEIIEQYLNGTLPAEERQALEQRLETDAAFSAELELHRQLHREFADPKKLALRDMMRELVEETPAVPAGQNRSWKIAAIALAMLVLGWAGWHWLAPERVVIPPASQDEIKSTAPANEPIATPDNTNQSTEPQEKTPEQPIAQADPKAYLPNRAFEGRLGSMVRSTDGSVKMNSPAMGATLKAENGTVKINFRGTAPADADTAQFPLALKIYDNKVNFGKPLYRILPTIADRKTADETWAFSTIQKLQLKPGLYYYTLERVEEEDLIFAGKFRVE